ncbi:hypothetical protein CKJ65_21655 [Mycobacterium intracellulare]|nr:hypothetical protein CKJ61_21650 [Mycobacterium intracellulare]PBA29373.1 hypothetical protein CKJ65_21655 [Mycobacterium intracellulare]
MRPGFRAQIIHVLSATGAPIGPADVGRSSVAPDSAPLFTCRGPPAPAVGCVTLARPRRADSRSKFVALEGWDRTRPFGRWSYARPGANPAQGNLNSMP